MFQYFIPMPEHRPSSVWSLNFNSKYVRPAGVALLNIVFASLATFALVYAAAAAVRLALL